MELGACLGLRVGFEARSAHRLPISICPAASFWWSFSMPPLSLAIYLCAFSCPLLLCPQLLQDGIILILISYLLSWIKMPVRKPSSHGSFLDPWTFLRGVTGEWQSSSPHSILWGQREVAWLWLCLWQGWEEGLWNKTRIVWASGHHW